MRDPGWTNEELQEYTDSDENIYVEDGKLILKAVKTEKDDNEGRLEFNMGAQGSTATICIRNVKFEEIK